LLLEIRRTSVMFWMVMLDRHMSVYCSSWSMILCSNLKGRRGDKE
jgi:hypothetical protein